MFSSLGVGYMIKREEKCVCKYNREKKLVMMRSFLLLDCFDFFGERGRCEEMRRKRDGQRQENAMKLIPFSFA